MVPARVRAGTGPLFAIRLRSDSYGRGFGPSLPASVPGRQMPGFDAGKAAPMRDTPAIFHPIVAYNHKSSQSLDKIEY